VVPRVGQSNLVTSVIETRVAPEYTDNIMKLLLRNTLVWGFILWIIGYVLGIILFAVVPHSLIGWVIMPIGVLVTLWVLLKKIKATSFQQYILIGFIWAIIAIVCDYFLLVKLFKPADGYYKLDVYLYYLLTFLLPIFVGWKNHFKTA
jgi:hypothetical protein